MIRFPSPPGGRRRGVRDRGRPGPRPEPGEGPAASAPACGPTQPAVSPAPVALSLLVMVGAGCGVQDAGPTESGSGEMGSGSAVLAASTRTTGGSPDPDGYAVTLDGARTRPVGTDSTVTFSGLPAGSLSVELGDVAANCALSGRNPRTLAVGARDTGSVAFGVSCQTGDPADAGSLVDLEVDWSTHRRTARGADNWPLTWADDGRLYATWGDGTGWSGDGSRASFGTTRISGPHDRYTGEDTCGDPDTEGGCRPDGGELRGKSYGILALDGVLYSFISAGSNVQAYPGADLHVSADGGRSWQETGVRIDGTDDPSENIVHPVFLQAGRGYASAPDRYVYIYGADIKDASSLAIQAPGDIWLLRVHRDSLEEKSAYQWYTSSDPSSPTWGPRRDRQPVFEDPEGVSWTTGSVARVPGLEEYVLLTEHSASLSGNLQVHAAPEPWGPWREVTRISNWPAGGEVEATTFFWNLSPRWFRDGGRAFTLVFSGVGSNDAWNTVDGRFHLSGR